MSIARFSVRPGFISAQLRARAEIWPNEVGFSRFPIYWVDGSGFVRHGFQSSLTFLALSYDEDFAKVRGVRVELLYFLLLAMVALSVVMIIRIVGLILVIALLTIPPYIAEEYSGSLRAMMFFSFLLSCFFTMVGLWISYLFNLTSGATIIMVAGVCFFISLFLELLRSRRPFSSGN